MRLTVGQPVHMLLLQFVLYAATAAAASAAAAAAAAAAVVAAAASATERFRGFNLSIDGQVAHYTRLSAKVVERLVTMPTPREVTVRRVRAASAPVTRDESIAAAATTAAAVAAARRGQHRTVEEGACSFVWRASTDASCAE